MRRYLLIVFCLLLALPSTALAGKRSSKRTATTASTSTAHLFGYNDASVQVGQMDATSHAALARDGGASTHRITFDWRWAEPQRGSVRFDTYDALYKAQLAAGIKPIFVILYSPQWTWAAGTPCDQYKQDCRYPPSDMSAWRDIVRKLVLRYPKMAALEVWNEPNMRLFWHPGADPAHYAQLVKTAYSAVRGAGSKVPVLGGSVTVPPEGEGNMHVRPFLDAMYANGVKGRMHGLAIHPYPGDVDLWRAFKTITVAREIRDANGDSATPLWFTETGSSIAEAGVGGQARLLSRLYARARSYSDVRATIVHTLLPRTNASVFDAGYGVVALDLAKRPAYCALAAANGVTKTCTAEEVVRDEAQEHRWDAQELVQSAHEAARSYKRTNGSYSGLTSAKLAAIDPRLSAVPADGAAPAGPDADPRRIGVYVWTDAIGENVEVCNASRADLSYCIRAVDGRILDYGAAAGSIFAAAGATNNGASTSW